MASGSVALHPQMIQAIFLPKRRLHHRFRVSFGPFHPVTVSMAVDDQVLHLVLWTLNVLDGQAAIWTFETLGINHSDRIEIWSMLLISFLNQGYSIKFDLIGWRINRGRRSRCPPTPTGPGCLPTLHPSISFHLAYIITSPIQDIIPLGETEPNQIFTRIVMIECPARDACDPRPF